MVGIAKFIVLPIVAVVAFIVLWGAAARTVVSDSVRLPNLSETWNAGKQLFVMHAEERAKDRQKKEEKSREAVELMRTAKKLEKQAST
ncbi:MAG: ABC transporter permease, partial [Planctomycetota bacterium]